MGNKKKEAYQIIKNGVNKWVVEDTFEYQHMSYQGLTSRQEIYIRHYIEQALNIITKENNKEWVEKISYDIVYGIDGFFNGFIETGIWELIYSHLDSETISNLIYTNIIWQLGNDKHWPCILEDIAVIICEKCGIKTTYIDNDNICFDCYEKIHK